MPSIAVIPARGGSKRIARKNVKKFLGRPMISYAIQAAQASKLFEHVIVSTDDDEIAAIARSWNAEIPFMRPVQLADDFTGTVPVIAHAIQECENLGWLFNWVCCIYPSVPLIQTEDLALAFELLNNSQAQYAFPIAQYPHPIQRALRLASDGELSPFYPEHSTTRTQDLEAAYHDAGQFYWGRKAAWVENKNVHRNGVGLVIPAWRAIDIDTPEDWHRAEVISAAKGVEA